MSTVQSTRESISASFYKYGLFVVFSVLVLAFSLFNPNFFSGANAVNLLQQTASTGIAAAGLVFVLVSGGIDISMGSTIFLSSVIVTTLANQGMGLAGAFAVALFCGIVVGSLNGFFVSVLKIPPLIVTLASLYIVRGVALALTGVQSLFFFNKVGDAVAYFRIGGVVPFVVIILACTLFLAQLVLSRTLFGRQLFAIGNNARGARITGIKVKRNVFLTYVISGALAGLAGLVSGAQVGAITPTFAEGQEFIIITSAILGGVSLFGGKGAAFPGAFLGVMIVMCIENGLVMAGANMYFYTIVRGIVIFLAVMIDCLRNKGELR
jgi:ribose transport system permease protein